MRKILPVISLCVVLGFVTVASAQESRGLYGSYSDLSSSLSLRMSLLEDAKREGDAEGIRICSADIAQISAAMDEALKRGETPYDWMSRTKLEQQMQYLWKDAMKAMCPEGEYTTAEEYDAIRAFRKLRMTCIALVGNFRRELEDLQFNETLLRIRLDSPSVLEYEKKPARLALEKNLSLQAAARSKMFLSHGGALFFTLAKPLAGKKIERWPSVSFF